MFSSNEIVSSAFNYVDSAIANSVSISAVTADQGKHLVYCFDNGKQATVMPSITDVKVIKEKVVIVSFADGTQEKAVCAEGDVFSVESGVTICLMKKLLADKCHTKSGTSIYNKLVKFSMDKVGANERKRRGKKERIRAEKRNRKEAHDKESQQKRNNRKYMTDICAEALKKVPAEVQDQ